MASEKKYLEDTARKLFPLPPPSVPRQSLKEIIPTAQVQHSFIQDLLPSAEAVKAIEAVASFAGKGLVKGANLLAENLSNSPAASSSSQQQELRLTDKVIGPTNPWDNPREVEIGRERPPSPPQPERQREEDQATMPTTFVREIKVKDLKTFNGTPADLDSFDNAVKVCLLSQNLPLYYGGWVTGDPDDEYQYVAPNTANAKSNYTIGKRMCMAMVTKLEGTALKWWEEYDSNPTSAVPNCWKKHGCMPRPIDNGNGTTVEVSLFELLQKKFCGDMDARVAEIELGRYKWEPFKRDNTVNLISFRTSIERLLKRAQKTSVFERIRHIRNSLPAEIKSKTEICDTEDELWKRIEKVHVTLEVDEIDSKQHETKRGEAGKCKYCDKVGHSEDVCRKKKYDENKGSTDKVTTRTAPTANATSAGRSGSACFKCGFIGHDMAHCYSKRHKDGHSLQPESKVTTSTSQATTGQGKPTEARTTTNTVERIRLCYRCHGEGHLARDCKVVPTNVVIAKDTGKDTLATYALPTTKAAKKGSVFHACCIAKDEVEERDCIVIEKELMPLPLFNVLSQAYVENEVFTVPVVDANLVPDVGGCLWAMSETAGGQQLLTVWDTGAVVCIVPMSTVIQTKTKWQKGSDINFLMADGLETSPIGIAEKFVFKLESKYFAVKVYIVEKANFQLLLGTEFMVAVGAALFPRWSTIMVTIPGKLQITAYCKRISVAQGSPPLQDEDAVEIEEDDGTVTISAGGKPNKKLTISALN